MGDQGKIVGARRRRAGEESSESDEGAVPVSAPTTIVGKDGHGTAPPWTSASKKETEPPPAEGGGQAVTFQETVDMTSGDKPHESPTTTTPAEPEGSAHVETPDEVQKEEEE